MLMLNHILSVFKCRSNHRPALAWVFHSLPERGSVLLGLAPLSFSAICYYCGRCAHIRWRNCFCYQKEALLSEESDFALCGVSHLGPLVMHYILNVILSDIYIFCLEVQPNVQQGKMHGICYQMYVVSCQSMCCCPPLAHILSDCECV